MFIGLTPYNNPDTKKYYNTDYIRSFRKNERDHFTVLELQYGTDLVKERPEEIIELLKRE